MMRRLAVLPVLVLVVAVGLPARAGVREDHWSPIVDSLQEQHRTYTVAATAHADGLLQVSIKRQDGTPLFQSVYPVLTPDGRPLLEWTYYDADGSMLTRSNPVPAEVTPTISAMASAGKDIVRMVGNGLEPGSHNIKPGKIRTDDQWGCDLPEYADIECTTRGNCCDFHDACYATGNCSYWSWLGVQNLWCEACNATVLLCITTGLGSSGQPSVCCQYGNCDVERCESDPFNPDCFDGPIVTGPDKDLIPGVEPSGGGGNGAGTPYWGYSNPWVGGASTGGGMCTFPNGAVVPCG
jgi:hypothetical protein